MEVAPGVAGSVKVQEEMLRLKMLLRLSKTVLGSGEAKDKRGFGAVHEDDAAMKGLAEGLVGDDEFVTQILILRMTGFSCRFTMTAF